MNSHISNTKQEIKAATQGWIQYIKLWTKVNNLKNLMISTMQVNLTCRILVFDDIYNAI